MFLKVALSMVYLGEKKLGQATIAQPSTLVFSFFMQNMGAFFLILPTNVLLKDWS